MQAFVRAAIYPELLEIRRIDRECYGQPWKPQTFNLAGRHALVVQGGHDDQPVGPLAGFVVFSIYGAAPGRGGLIYLERIGVTASCIRYGLGSALVRHLQRNSKTRPFPLVTDVAEHNLGGQVFLRANGFRCLGEGPDGLEFVWGEARDHGWNVGGQRPGERVADDWRFWHGQKGC